MSAEYPTLHHNQFYIPPPHADAQPSQSGSLVGQGSVIYRVFGRSRGAYVISLDGYDVSDSRARPLCCVRAVTNAGLGGVLEKDSAPHLTARQEQTVKLLESHKAPFRRYPECFLCLVGLSPYYPFDENSYPPFDRPDGTGRYGLVGFYNDAVPSEGPGRGGEVHSSALAIPVDTTAAATASIGAAATTRLATDVDPDLAGPSYPEELEGSDDSFYAPTTLDPFEASAARQVCLGAEVRSCAEHELELKEKLRVKYAAHGRLLGEMDLEILELKSKLAKKVESLALDCGLLCQLFEGGLYRRDWDSVLLSFWRLLHDWLVFERISRRNWISSARRASSERVHRRFYFCGAELENIIGNSGQRLGRGCGFGMQEGLEVGYEHGVAGRSISMVDAYNPEAARASYVDAVKALEDASFPLVDLLKCPRRMPG
ncbi:hypothetical protein Tco_1201802 [Tanacetum coccineum]